MTIHYGSWEHLTIVFTTTEAWVLSGRTGQWEELHPAEACCNGRLMTKAQFQRIPDVPELPSQAFRYAD